MNAKGQFLARLQRRCTALERDVEESRAQQALSAGLVRQLTSERDESLALLVRRDQELKALVLTYQLLDERCLALYVRHEALTIRVYRLSRSRRYWRERWARCPHEDVWRKRQAEKGTVQWKKLIRS